MKKILAAIFIICVGIAAAHAGGFTLLHVGDSNGNGGAPLTPCASTGIYDLSNVCNDIYFIGALK